MFLGVSYASHSKRAEFQRSPLSESYKQPQRQRRLPTHPAYVARGQLQIIIKESTTSRAWCFKDNTTIRYSRCTRSQGAVAQQVPRVALGEQWCTVYDRRCKMSYIIARCTVPFITQLTAVWVCVGGWVGGGGGYTVAKSHVENRFRTISQRRVVRLMRNLVQFWLNSFVTFALLHCPVLFLVYCIFLWSGWSAFAESPSRLSLSLSLRGKQNDTQTQLTRQNSLLRKFKMGWPPFWILL